ncbi:conjugal transfer protein TraM [Pseudomonas sp. R9.37]|uniref:conjugal transfer protein TraM n=1 Tax=Pseudomonas sp. R9.37 TaxID=1390498 RepID=UPI000D0DAC4D|nr:conjugal transfer protein TraM [Pseudomonas sp. R9.37]PSL90777.1 conjugal transfer protein TraM [Pseudomonas sp. R9.37]
MSDDLESLRQEIHRVHGISVDLNDPMMCQHTMNKHLLAQMTKGQEELLEQFKSELEGIAYQWGNDAKEKAERILNASLAASKEAMASLMKESLDDVAKSMRAEFENALRKTEAPAQSARKWISLNIAATVMTLTAALLVAWSAI